MPMYEYECKKCGSVFEVLQKISDSPPKKCEECNSKRVSRIMSESAFHLKGSGWYKTDYAGSSTKTKKGENSESSSTSSESSDSTSSAE